MARYNYQQISFEAPAEWTDASVITLAGPVKNGLRSTVVVTSDEPAEPIELGAYVDAQIKELRKQFKKYTLHKQEATTAGQRNAVLVEHAFRTPENVMIRQMQLYVPKGRAFVCMSLSAGDSEFEQHRDQFAEIARSFKIN